MNYETGPKLAYLQPGGSLMKTERNLKEIL